MRDSITRYEEVLDSVVCFSKIEILDSPSCIANNEFWLQLGQNLRYLKMDFNDNFQKFADILIFIPNLKSLDLHFNDVTVTTINMRKITFKKLKTFIFYMDQYCNPIILTHLLPMMVEADQITLDINPPLPKISRECLFHFLKKAKSKIKSLKISVDPKMLNLIWDIKGMELNTFSVRTEKNFNMTSSFTDRLKLLHLGVPTYNDTRSSIGYFAYTFPNLQTLKFQKDLGEDITDLKKLTKLKVSTITNFFIYKSYKKLLFSSLYLCLTWMFHFQTFLVNMNLK